MKKQKKISAELSQRVGKVMDFILPLVGFDGRDLFIKRLDKAVTFDKLSKEDQEIITIAESNLK